MFGLLKPYTRMIVWLIVLSLLSNGINLILPLLISRGVDAYSTGKFIVQTTLIEFIGATLFIFLFTYLQSVVQTYASERVARDLRTQLAAKLSRPSTTAVTASSIRSARVS